MLCRAWLVAFEFRQGFVDDIVVYMGRFLLALILNLIQYVFKFMETVRMIITVMAIVVVVVAVVVAIIVSAIAIPFPPLITPRALSDDTLGRVHQDFDCGFVRGGKFRACALCGVFAFVALNFRGALLDALVWQLYPTAAPLFAIAVGMPTVVAPGPFLAVTLAGPMCSRRAARE